MVWLEFILNYPSFFVFLYLAWRKDYSWLETRFKEAVAISAVAAIVLHHSFIWVPMFMLGTKLLRKSQKTPLRTMTMSYSLGIISYILGYALLLFYYPDIVMAFLPVLYYITYLNHKKGFSVERQLTPTR